MDRDLRRHVLLDAGPLTLRSTPQEWVVEGDLVGPDNFGWRVVFAWPRTPAWDERAAAEARWVRPPPRAEGEP